MAVGGTKGGYQPRARLEGLLDEIDVEAQVAAGEPSSDVMREAFREIVRLVRSAKGLASYLDCGHPPMAAGAGA